MDVVLPILGIVVGACLLKAGILIFDYLVSNWFKEK